MRLVEDAEFKAAVETLVATGVSRDAATVAAAVLVLAEAAWEFANGDQPLYVTADVNTSRKEPLHVESVE